LASCVLLTLLRIISQHSCIANFNYRASKLERMRDIRYIEFSI
jgi:hypothetical protein